MAKNNQSSTKINKIETKKSIERVNESENWFMRKSEQFTSHVK